MLLRLLRPVFLSAAACAVTALTFASPAAIQAEEGAAEAQWKEDDEGVSLMRGDELLFRYTFRSGNKPIVYPLPGPGGQSMVRDFPMKDAPEGGTTDHPHHRGLWFTHGEVNDLDFWAEKGASAGIVEHKSVDEKKIDGNHAILKTTAHWMGKDDKPLLKETRLTRFDLRSASRLIDFKIELEAVAEKVNFGDTKEGSFAIRVPDSMAVTSKQGGKIVNSEGDIDGDAWGVKARWVDYTGPVEDGTAGITILEHPKSFGHPCRWHVRTYGLFAANPFGEFHFTGGKRTEGHTLNQGESLTVIYRVALHEGPAPRDFIEKQWSRFAGEEF